MCVRLRYSLAWGSFTFWCQSYACNCSLFSARALGQARPTMSCIHLVYCDVVQQGNNMNCFRYHYTWFLWSSTLGHKRAEFWCIYCSGPDSVILPLSLCEKQLKLQCADIIVYFPNAHTLLPGICNGIHPFPGLLGLLLLLLSPAHHCQQWHPAEGAALYYKER